MFLVSLFLLASCFGLVSGEPETSTVVGGRHPDSNESVLDTCQALKEEAQDIREEGYSAIDKADMIREQAYRVKDEAYEIKESAMEARSALETTLVETLALMKSSATATNLYIQEIRTTLSSVTSRMDRLEQGQGQIKEKELETLSSMIRKMDMMEEEIEDRIDEKTALLSEKLLETLAAVEIIKDQQRSGETSEEWKSGELIPADRVVQSSTYISAYGYDYGAEKAVDGDPGTESHTSCDLARQWFKYFFSEERAIGHIKVVNGVWNTLKYRLNGAKVSVMASDIHRRACRANTITVRAGDTLQAQTYYLDCTGNTGIGVEFVLDTGTYLEFGEIEVYAP